MLKIIKWLLFVFVILVIASVATVYVLQEPIPASVADTDAKGGILDPRFAAPIAKLSEDLEGDRRSLVAPSISVAVAIDGELIWADARGYADIGSKIVATPETRYAIGSVSKPVTAALTALLWERRMLNIDADIREYVPGYPAKPYPITLRQLLSHQAGIRHYRFSFLLPTFSESQMNREFSSTADRLALFSEDDLLFEPDTGFNYSTFGYTLVSAAIENVTGKPYDVALNHYLLKPLAMRRTTVDRSSMTKATRATDYVGTFSKKAVIRAPETNSSYKWAGAGLVSTPTDLAVFGSMLLDDRLLGASTRETVFTARALRSGELNPQHYGLGWRIGGLLLTDEETGEETIIDLYHHGGTRAGSAAILMIVPDYALVVAMASNSIGRGGSAPLTSVAAKVARAFIRFEVDEGRGMIH